MDYASVYMLFGWLLVEVCVWNEGRGGERLTWGGALFILSLWPLMILMVLHQLLRRI